MRCLVIGCGSIGSRRARVLAGMGHEVLICDTDPKKVIGNYMQVGEAGGYEDEDGPRGATATVNLEFALALNPEAAFICTPPETHLELAEKAARAGILGIFVEKPLALQEPTNAWLSAFEEHGCVTMGACNMRFDERVIAMDGKIREAKNVVFRMGQAAEHWSPNHQKQTLLLDDIHELDLALWLRGAPTAMRGYSQDDLCLVKIEQGERVSWVHLDRITDPPIRFIERRAMEYLGDNVDRVTLWPPDMEMYRREMEHFLECVKEGKPTCNPLAQAAETLKWALEVVG